ncbi:adenosine-specific kinase [bacterium]|nr:adenosine-specific kinase [bacterium]
MGVNFEEVPLDFPEEANIILGHSHFIKTIEDLYEIMVSNVPQAKYGIAFSEASAEKLIRTEGNNEDLIKCAAGNLQKIACGHTFLVVLKDAYPINVLNSIKACQEVCRIYCATANPTRVIVARTEQGGAIIGVVDGYSPDGVEQENNKKVRKEFLREIGYKLI